MNTLNVLNGYTLTSKETKACLELISKMRAKEARERLVNEHTHAIWYKINQSIDAIGLEETKRIVRQLNRELREIEEES